MTFELAFTIWLAVTLLVLVSAAVLAAMLIPPDFLDRSSTLGHRGKAARR